MGAQSAAYSARTAPEGRPRCRFAIGDPGAGSRRSNRLPMETNLRPFEEDTPVQIGLAHLVHIKEGVGYAPAGGFTGLQGSVMTSRDR